MSEGTGDGTQGAQENGAPEGEQAKTFTQDEVNQLVGQARTDERRKVAAKFADYDDLKAKAGEKATADERLAELEKEIESTKREAMRRRVQAAHQIADEDADLFLTGTDEETLTAQAKRLADRETERKSKGNHVPREGETPKSTGNDDERAFVRQLFAKDD